ncbi:MAG TPA: biotin--[acetyl-CoA-carboxylase] ligase [Woeseiaceae bacterium]|nr:biotin--[acetyl-CoA-carboxylase] ligase [Woeseiaceae bacterium]
MTTLDGDRVRELLLGSHGQCVDDVVVFDRIDSTNSYLRDQAAPPQGRFRVVVADHQTAGRGQRERRWISAPGRSLCLSLSFVFREQPEALSALTLALGVGVAECLGDIGARHVRLKWPNDLIADQGKLGGILVETQYRSASDIVVIAGVGINLQVADGIDDELHSGIELRATDLASQVKNLPPREQLAALVAGACCDCVLEFAAQGFAPFALRYGTYDWLAGKDIGVTTASGRLDGTADGVDKIGALRLVTRTGVQSIVSGTVTAVPVQ